VRVVSAHIAYDEGGDGRPRVPALDVGLPAQPARRGGRKLSELDVQRSAFSLITSPAGSSPLTPDDSARAYKSSSCSRLLPREIASQSGFDITFAPRTLEIFLALRCVAFVETAFPIYKLKWRALLG
jgi:hypothetical protein